MHQRARGQFNGHHFAMQQQQKESETVFRERVLLLKVVQDDARHQ